MERNRGFSKSLFIAFYLLTMVIVVFYAWNKQNSILQGRSIPLYRNLMEYPAYIKKGFDPSEIHKVPSENSGEWVCFNSPPLRIMNSRLPDLPNRAYLSPRGREAEEFTIAILLEMDSHAMAFLNSDISVLPGIFLACIGENWEIFLNGKLVRKEMHLDETGKITSRRTWRNVYFPLDRSIFVPGTNVLAFRIVGDPVYDATGLYYAAPYYMDDYHVIEARQKYFLLIIIAGIFGFTGIYYLVFFLSIRKKQEIFSLYFSILSFLLFGYAITRNGLVNYIIQNSDISIRIEYFCLYLLVPTLGLFVESVGWKKVTKISRIFLGFFLLLALSQIFYCNQFADETLFIWNVSVLAYTSYIVFYDVVYFYFFKHRKAAIQKNTELSFSYIVAGSVFIFACGINDVLDVMFFHNSFHLFLYSTFGFHIVMALALSQRFSGMYKQLEQSNVTLEIAVQDRTRELEEQTRVAVEASRAKSEFLATMSHEIRTPLNAVIGLSEIELEGRLPDSSRENITQIYQSGSSLLGIINDILDISKIEAGGFELVPVEYDVASFLSDTINLNRVRIGSKPITFKFEINGDFPGKLIGDELRVKQVLNNLLSNAIKYTQKGTITLNAEWSLIALRPISPAGNHAEKTEKAALLRFTIRDTGIGIRKGDMGKLFSGYTQLDAKANRKIEGTGLGLVITKKLVEMMGGCITAESEYGKGSVFTVEMAQVIEDIRAIGEETAGSLRNFNYTADRKGEVIVRSWMPYGKVLVVDDMPVNLQVARGLLVPYGFRVDTAGSGQEAIEKIQAEKPQYDLIFMDHMMPEMDGIETVKIIRAWEKETQPEAGASPENGIPIVALTANALVGNMEMFLSSGFNGYISKPIDINQLDEALNKWVRDKQNPGTLRPAETSLTNKQQPHSSLPNIPGVDIQSGITMTGGTVDGYCQVLELFGKDIEERLPMLQTVDENSLLAFTTQVHALKSASATIGAADISERAAELEAAGKAADIELIRKKLPGFSGPLAELAKNIHKALESEEKNIPRPERSSQNAGSPELFGKLAQALESQDAYKTDRILDELNQTLLNPDAKKILDRISDYVLMTEFDSATDLVKEYNRNAFPEQNGEVK